jgi:hypothetical protein
MTKTALIALIKEAEGKVPSLQLRGLKQEARDFLVACYCAKHADDAPLFEPLAERILKAMEPA